MSLKHQLRRGPQFTDMRFGPSSLPPRLPSTAAAAVAAGEDLEAFAGAGLYDSIPFPGGWVSASKSSQNHNIRNFGPHFALHPDCIHAALWYACAALEHRAVDYAGEALLWDGAARQQLLQELVQLGAEVEGAFGGVPQVGPAQWWWWGGRWMGGSGRCLLCLQNTHNPCGLWSERGRFCCPKMIVLLLLLLLLLLQDIEGVRTAQGGLFVVQARPQVLH